MGNNISVVINTLNEEKNIERALKSVDWAEEVIVCDMHSEDQTVVLAKKFGAKVFLHEKTGYVEPARNFAISKASNDWVLILDADEEIPAKLGKQLKEISGQEQGPSFVEIPRKNIIFGKWMRASGWWPDINIRFFKKGSVKWSNKIHSKPEVFGQGLTLSTEEDFSIIHHNYESIGQFTERLNRYTTVQAEHLKEDGYNFIWSDLITKPVNEFLSRYFANRGFEDGLHGLALSLLQAFSFLVMYLKVWEMEKFEPKQLNLMEVRKAAEIEGREIKYWFKQTGLSESFVRRSFQRIANKFS